MKQPVVTSGPNKSILRLKVKLGIQANSPTTIIEAEHDWLLYELKEQVSILVAQIGDEDVDPEQVRIVTCGRHLESDESTLESLGVQSKYHVIAVISTQKKSASSLRKETRTKTVPVSEPAYLAETETKSAGQFDDDGYEDIKLTDQEIPQFKETELHRSVKMGELKIAAQIIKNLGEEELNRVLGTQNSEGMTPIMYAATEGNTKLFSSMLDKMDEKQLMLQANNGMTVMHLATKSGNTQFMKRLLKDASPQFADMQDSKGRTALYYALKRKNCDVKKDLVKIMTQEGLALQTFEGWSCLHVSATRGLDKMCKILMQAMRPEHLELQTQQGSTVLHLAVSKGKLKIAELLLGKMSDKALSIQNGKGSTALHLAVFKARLRIIPKLLAKMTLACIMLKRLDGNTALHMAARKGRTDMVKMFVRNLGTKCLVELTSDNSTPLHLAAQNGHDDTVQYIAKHCGDAAFPMLNARGFTPLALAAEGDRPDTVRILVEKSKPQMMRVRTFTGKTPIHFAAMNGNLKMLQILYKAMGNDALAIRDDFGWNSLHCGCAAGHIALVEEIVELLTKAELCLTENSGRNALHLAAQYGHDNILKILEKHFPEESWTCVTRNGSTLAHLAANNDHRGVIGLLIEMKSVSIFDVKDNYNLTAAQRAAQRGLSHVAQLISQVTKADDDHWKPFLPENRSKDSLWLSNLFGVELMSPEGNKSTVEVAKECEVVGLLFSTSSKFGDGEEFIPTLRDSYMQLRNSGKNIELIYISSDKDEAAFNNYYTAMPWLALPYPDRTLQIRLAMQFRLNGFRSAVVLVDPKTGVCLNKYGREAIVSDPVGLRFPWRRHPKEFWDVFKGELLKAGRIEPISTRSLKRPNRFLGIYFTDNESVQSREFTRTLTKFYRECKLNEQSYGFDVVLAPCMDNDQGFRDTVAEIPFFTLPLGSEACEELKLLFEIYEEDRLVILRAETGELITANGRDGVELDPTRSRFPWQKAPVNFMTQDTFSAVSATPCCIILADGDDVDQSKFHKIFDALHPSGEQVAKNTRKNVRFGSLEFLVDNGDSGHTRFLRNIMDLKKKKDFVVIIDTFRMRVFPCREIKKLKDIKRKTIAEFVGKFNRGMLESYPLRI